MSDLKPCPFCGETERFMRFQYRFPKPGLKGSYIRCENCKSTSGTYETLEQAKDAWNTRTKERKYRK